MKYHANVLESELQLSWEESCNDGNIVISLSGIFVPKTIRSLEHSFPWWNFRSRDHLFLGTFVPWTVRSLELSFSRLFVPWNIRSLDRSFHRTLVPWNFRSRYPGPFLPLTVRAAVPGLEQRNKQKRRHMTATVHSRYTQTVDRYSFKPVQ